MSTIYLYEILQRPLTIAEVDANMKSLQEADALKMPLAGSTGAVSFGAVTATAGAQLATSSGNVLIGTTTDDGVNKLQVNGSGRFAGGISASALPVYADNTAAAALLVGTMYRTSTGTVMIKY